MLDFVPNHTALDHPWVASIPSSTCTGSEEDLAANPHNYCALDTAHGPRI